jgi:hypothetical protein
MVLFSSSQWIRLIRRQSADAEPRQPYSLSIEQKYAIYTLSTRSKENLQAFWGGHLKLKMGFQRVFAQHQIHVFSLFSALR